MASWLSSLFSKTTHVANGYHEDIYAKVETDKSAAKETAYTVKVAGQEVNTKTTYETKFSENSGYTKIAPGQHIGFHTKQDLDGEVRVTIKTASGKEVCSNHPVQVNRSVIVDKNAQLKEAKYSTGPYGESKIWTDKQGNDHYPKNWG